MPAKGSLSSSQCILWLKTTLTSCTYVRLTSVTCLTKKLRYGTPKGHAYAVVSTYVVVCTFIVA